jgi:hypothetical protein
MINSEEIQLRARGGSYLVKCIIKARDGDDNIPLFVINSSGAYVHLYKYAVIPLEEYHELTKERDIQEAAEMRINKILFDRLV